MTARCSGKFWRSHALATAAVLGGMGVCVGCYDGHPASAASAADAGGVSSSEGGDDGVGESDAGPDGAPGADLEAENVVAIVGLRRLSNHEFGQAIFDLIGDDSVLGTAISDESANPFDNASEFQEISSALVETAEQIATSAAERLVDDPMRMATVVGCDQGDAACLEQFVVRFGRRVFRRPLTDVEVGNFASVPAADFGQSVQTIVAAMLQHPEFLYRVEVGTEVAEYPGVYRLNGYEIATRLSFLLWGTTPTDALLDAAEQGELDRAEDVAQLATEMLDDVRARQQLVRYYAMLLGYESLSHEHADAMRAESAALIERSVFDEARPWHDLFTAPQTYVTPQLAELYGIVPPEGGQADWVEYDGSQGRAGILSHGTFLSLGVPQSTVTPTARGRQIRRRLYCDPVELPEDNQAMNADVDARPPEEMCRREWYETVHAADAACQGCHSRLDPIGFGLEKFDYYGRYFETEDGKPQCALSGAGELEGLGSFNGPGELGALLTTSKAFDRCMLKTLFMFAVGRSEQLAEDLEIIGDLNEGLDLSQDSMLDAVLAIASDPAFGYRREAPQGE